jgi:molybdopterin/thiamine biosynthesis adenylyltransferase
LGVDAQKALVEARICLLSAGPTGTESLKNLVLPGCGHVTIVDGEHVTAADVGNNFFVTPEDVGQLRAAVRAVAAIGGMGDGWRVRGCGGRYSGREVGKCAYQGRCSEVLAVGWVELL